MKRTVILVNKDFEYKGFIEGLRKTLPVYAGTNGRDAECRLDVLNADIYCIQHLFGKGENSSNSEVKFGLLKKLFIDKVFGLKNVDYLISVSTSESTPAIQGDVCSDSRNGCVYIGNRFFISDQSKYDETTSSHLVIGNAESGNTEVYSDEPIYSDLYNAINKTQMNLEPVTHNPAKELKCIAGVDFMSIGVANVMDYSCYKKADAAAYDWFVSHYSDTSIIPIGIETTHGIVKKAFETSSREQFIKNNIPVMFVSPITDRYLKFDEDVDGTDGKQNFECSYNSGIATGNVLILLNKLLMNNI